jgi:hypothetical protein
VEAEAMARAIALAAEAAEPDQRERQA